LGVEKLTLNGQALRKNVSLKSTDRIEWSRGSAVFLSSDLSSVSTETAAAKQSMELLLNLTSALQSPGSVELALRQVLDGIVEMACAEEGYLLSDNGGAGWQMTASQKPESRKAIFSNTILQEALKRRETIYVENMIGHPWSDAHSVIQARIFSAACIPLFVQERVFGAIFLISRSPGQSIRKEALSDLSILATHAALLMGMSTQLQSTQLENARLRVSQDATSELIFSPECEPMVELYRKIQKLAPTPLNILVTGETGTGKERVAQEIHRLSSRSKGPFIALNCAAIPTTLLESTLFGHEKGAFTGAVRAQVGRFVAADGGTLFLDEIGDLPYELQAKLLRVLQENIVEPLGAQNPVTINIRVLAATHQNLEDAVRAGRFRQDLYFRLAGAALKIEPLRNRKEDISILSQVFLDQTGTHKKLSQEAVSKLASHTWPGNVRELQQVLAKAAFMAETDVIGGEDIEYVSQFSPLGLQAGEGLSLVSLEQAQLQFTTEYVRKALDRHQGNRAQTASLLGVSERTLYRILATGPDAAGRLS